MVEIPLSLILYFSGCGKRLISRDIYHSHVCWQKRWSPGSE